MPRINDKAPRPIRPSLDGTANKTPTAATQPAAVANASTSAPAAKADAGSGVHQDDALRSVGSARFVPTRDDARTREAIQTFFAPYDEPIKQDLALIDEVAAARRADPRQFADGANPYSIKYAVYNLRHPDVINALIDAHRAGVDVQILIEDAQLDPARTWNTADEQLVAAGFKMALSQRGLSEAQRKELNLIGIESAGYMHLKTRIFERPDPAGGPSIEKVLSGSHNPGDETGVNDETLHLITDRQLVERYKAKYQSVLEGTDLANVWQQGAPVNVLFAPTQHGPQAVDKLFELIDREQEAIFLSVFSLRNLTSPRQRDNFVDKLKKAHERGVNVVVVTDRKQSDGIDASGQKIGFDDLTDELLQAAGIPVYECINPGSPFAAMHEKSAIFGLTDMKVVTDCGNWSEAALGSRKRPARNDESFLFIDSKKLDDNRTGRRYLSNFLQLLRKYDAQQTAAPHAADLVNGFTRLPNWPRVKVDFDVVAATHAGQEVYITGEHEALGTWTKAGPGIRLNTSGGSYPLWNSDTSLELPFGLALEYKVVKRDQQSGELDWQPGPNQLLVVDDSDLRSPGADQRGGKLRIRQQF